MIWHGLFLTLAISCVLCEGNSNSTTTVRPTKERDSKDNGRTAGTIVGSILVFGGILVAWLAAASMDTEGCTLLFRLSRFLFHTTDPCSRRGLRYDLDAERATLQQQPLTSAVVEDGDVASMQADAIMLRDQLPRRGMTALDRR